MKNSGRNGGSDPQISPGKRCATKFGKALPSLSSIIKANSATKQVTGNWPNASIRLDQESGTRGNRLYYFAASPEQFEPILKNLKKAGLNKTREGKLGARHSRETVRNRSRDRRGT